MNKKLWRIFRNNSGHYYIAWRWSEDKGTMFPYEIKRCWKKLESATKYGLNYFGRNSENNGQL